MKKLKLLSLILIITIMLSSFAACGGCDHEWEDADCENPKTCEICGETEGEKGDHEWEDATCEKPKTCEICGETEGEKGDHEWEDATCEKPKACKVCGKTEGEAKGHKYNSEGVCDICGKKYTYADFGFENMYGMNIWVELAGEYDFDKNTVTVHQNSSAFEFSGDTFEHVLYDFTERKTWNPVNEPPFDTVTNGNYALGPTPYGITYYIRGIEVSEDGKSFVIEMEILGETCYYVPIDLLDISTLTYVYSDGGLTRYTVEFKK